MMSREKFMVNNGNKQVAVSRAEALAIADRILIQAEQERADLIKLEAERTRGGRMDKVTFLAMIDEGAGALKCSGSGNGGKLVLAFDDSQLPQAIKSLLLRKQLLTITLEPEDDFSD